MAKVASLFAAFMLVVAGVFALGVGTASAETCTARWDVAVGGLNGAGAQDSRYLPNANQYVGYNSYDTQAGVNELNRLVRQHRAACPGDHISMTGHSGGAAVVHVWIEQNGNIGNINAVLLADPKRAAGPGGPGFAQTDWPFNTIQPLAGANANFRGVPTLTVCRASDHICNSQAGWDGYAFRNAHGAYDMNVKAYATNSSGVSWLPWV